MEIVQSLVIYGGRKPIKGRPGEYQHRHQVYDREGMACPRCRRVVHRARFANRSTFFCEACQV